MYTDSRDAPDSVMQCVSPGGTPDTVRKSPKLIGKQNVHLRTRTYLSGPPSVRLRVCIGRPEPIRRPAELD